MAQSSDSFDWLKIIPLFLIWAVAYILESLSKQRVRSPRKKPSSTPPPSLDPETVLKEWQEAIIFDQNNQYDREVEEEFVDEEEYEQEPLPPQKSAQGYMRRQPSTDLIEEKVSLYTHFEETSSLEGRSSKKKKRILHKKNLVIFHEILSTPVSLRRSRL